jgi:hypothetical protein
MSTRYVMCEGMSVKDIYSVSRSRNFRKALGIEILITGSPLRMN